MPARRKDYDYAVTLYSQGLSIEDVAGYYGVTRQAMHKILKRRCAQFRSQLRYGEDNHFYRGGEVRKGNANDLLERALALGIVIRPDVCEDCGGSGTFADGRTAIQAHHPDYNRALDVVWLCQKCHHLRHQSERPTGIDE